MEEEGPRMSGNVKFDYHKFPYNMTLHVIRNQTAMSNIYGITKLRYFTAILQAKK